MEIFETLDKYMGALAKATSIERSDFGAVNLAMHMALTEVAGNADAANLEAKVNALGIAHAKAIDALGSERERAEKLTHRCEQYDAALKDRFDRLETWLRDIGYFGKDGQRSVVDIVGAVVEHGNWLVKRNESYQVRVQELEAQLALAQSSANELGQKLRTESMNVDNFQSANTELGVENDRLRGIETRLNAWLDAQDANGLDVVDAVVALFEIRNQQFTAMNRGIVELNDELAAMRAPAASSNGHDAAPSIAPNDPTWVIVRGELQRLAQNGVGPSKTRWDTQRMRSLPKSDELIGRFGVRWFAVLKAAGLSSPTFQGKREVANAAD